jgi:metallo-beta-lactamase family protein
MESRLTFLGAAENVTGSRHLLETDGARILVDCGLYQERDLLGRNWDPLPGGADTLDAILLTHAHLDHCGLLPKLVKDGFRGRVYCTQATAEIAQIVLLDSANLQEEDAAFKRKRHKKEGRSGPFPEEPLYSVEDTKACFELFSPVAFQEPVLLKGCVELTFHNAGHILGSSIIRLRSICDGKRIVLFTGDLGRNDKPILKDPVVCKEADYVLVESTYGDRTHDHLEDIKEVLCEAINSTIEAGGNIVIPSFSIERSQEVLYYLNELLLEKRIPHLMTILDSPMAIQVTDVFKRHPELYDEKMAELMRRHESPFSFAGLKMTPTTRESKTINAIKGTVIIIAGSGMCTGGRIKHHLAANITRPESTILFVGYQAKGTLGREIIDGNKEVRIFGQKFPVKARIVQAHGFSAHADRQELYTWLTHLERPPLGIFVVHGEKESAHNFADFLREKTGWKIVVPTYGQQIVLE